MHSSIYNKVSCLPGSSMSILSNYHEYTHYPSNPNFNLESHCYHYKIYYPYTFNPYLNTSYIKKFHPIQIIKLLSIIAPNEEQSVTPDRFLSYRIHKIIDTTAMDEKTMVFILFYIHKYVSNGHMGTIGSLFKLFLVSAILQNKYHVDLSFSNLSWANLLQLSINSLMNLEALFLNALGFSLFVDKLEFYKFELWINRMLER